MPKKIGHTHTRHLHTHAPAATDSLNMSRSDVTAALWADMKMLAVISLPTSIPWQYQFDMIGLYDTRTGRLRRACGAPVTRKGLNRISVQSASKKLLRLLPRCDDHILPQGWPYRVDTEEDLARLTNLSRLPRRLVKKPVMPPKKATVPSVVAAQQCEPKPSPPPASSPQDDVSSHGDRIKKLEACVRVLFGGLDVPASMVESKDLTARLPKVAQQLATSVAVQAYRAGALTGDDLESEHTFLTALSHPRMKRKLWLAVHPDKVRLPFATPEETATSGTAETLFDRVRPAVQETLERLCSKPQADRMWRHEWWCIHEYLSLMEWRAALLPRTTL